MISVNARTWSLHLCISQFSSALKYQVTRFSTLIAQINFFILIYLISASHLSQVGQRTPHRIPDLPSSLLEPFSHGMRESNLICQRIRRRTTDSPVTKCVYYSLILLCLKFISSNVRINILYTPKIWISRLYTFFICPLAHVAIFQ